MQTPYRTDIGEPDSPRARAIEDARRPDPPAPAFDGFDGRVPIARVTVSSAVPPLRGGPFSPAPAALDPPPPAGPPPIPRSTRCCTMQ